MTLMCVSVKRRLDCCHLVFLLLISSFRKCPFYVLLDKIDYVTRNNSRINDHRRQQCDTYARMWHKEEPQPQATHKDIKLESIIIKREFQTFGMFILSVSEPKPWIEFNCMWIAGLCLHCSITMTILFQHVHSNE